MKKDLLVVGLLVVLAALGVGVVVALQALKPQEEDVETVKPHTERIAQLPWKAPAVHSPARQFIAPPAKVEAKQEDKEPQRLAPIKDLEPKKEVKIEPKAEPKVDVKPEPQRPAVTKVIVLGNDIKLNDPDGEYALKTINGGDKIVIQGKIKTLTVAGINEKSTLDATLLEADEIIFTANLNSGASVFLGKAHSLRLCDINDKSTLDGSALNAQTIVIAGAINSGSVVKLNAPHGRVEIHGEINDRAQVQIVAPAGKVFFKGRGDAVINGDAQVSIIAKDVELRGAVNGEKTRLDVTLTKAGSLQFNRLNGRVRLHYRKADASDPEPRIDAGAISARAEFGKMPPRRK